MLNRRKEVIVLRASFVSPSLDCRLPIADCRFEETNWQWAIGNVLRLLELDVVVDVTAWAAPWPERRLTLCRRFIRLRLFELRTFRSKLGTTRKALLAIEEDLTVDERCIHARIDAERMSIPDCEVSVFADFNRTDSVLNAELNRGIDRHQPERLFFREVAPVHRFRSFYAQAARAFVGIGVHRNNDPGARQYRSVG